MSAVLDQLRRARDDRNHGRSLRTLTTPAPVSNTTPAAAGAPAARTVVRRDRPSCAEVDGMLMQIPAGQYALPIANPKDDGNDVTFFEIFVTKGRHMIRTLTGAPGHFASRTLPITLQYHAARHLLEDLVSATALFGQKTATCGRCGSPLTQKASRERGMGSHCANERAAGR